MADNPRPVPAGMVLLRHPETIGCSFGGISYKPDESGNVLVPAGATGELDTHGFFVVPDDQPSAPAPKPDRRDAVIANLKEDLDQVCAAIDQGAIAMAEMQQKLDAATARADAAEAALNVASAAQPPAPAGGNPRR